MCHLNSENLDSLLQSDSSSDDNDDNDDLVTFQFESEFIHLYYSQLFKYSKYVRDKYLFSNVIKCFPLEIQEFKNQNHINSDSIILFFQLLQQNFDTNENLNLSYKQCLDLLKIAEFLQINKLTKKPKKYVKTHNKNDPSFVIQIILHETENQNECNFQIKQQMEDLLATNINDCF